jgi:DNA-binding beta-propeller fold protein YncE
MREPVDLAMAPEGDRIYVLTHGAELINDGGVVTLIRQARGWIRQPAGKAGCITEQGTGTCAKGRSMDQGRRMALSLDGRSLYVTSETGGLAILQRSDNGGLAQPEGDAGCVISQFKPTGSTCARVPIPDMVPKDIVVSPDGAFVYVAMSQGGTGALVVYMRDQTSGALTFASCVAEGGGGAPCVPAVGLAGAEAIATSPDGRTVYAAAHWFHDGGTLTSFTRDATLGTLTQLETGGCLAAAPRDGCAKGPPFTRPSSLGVSHDGAAVYVVYANDTTGTGDGSILAEFGRDSTEGGLTYASCLARKRTGCGRVRGVYGFTRVTISVDGRYIYLGGKTGLGIFST